MGGYELIKGNTNFHSVNETKPMSVAGSRRPNAKYRRQINPISEEVTKMARTTEIISMHFTDFKQLLFSFTHDLND